MEILLTWEVFPDLVIRKFELMGEFNEEKQYATSKGFRLQRGFDATILDEGYGKTHILFSREEFKTD